MKNEITVEKYGVLGVQVLTRPIFEDDRGFFEVLHRALPELGHAWVEDNLSFSLGGVLRGLHYQAEKNQAKLVSCLRGTVFDVWVDLRRDSETFGKYESIVLSAGSGTSVLIPRGFAHGYMVMSETALVHYKVDEHYDGDLDAGIRWDDPTVKILWPFTGLPVLSERDRHLPLLSDIHKQG